MSVIGQDEAAQDLRLFGQPHTAAGIKIDDDEPTDHPGELENDRLMLFGEPYEPGV